VLCLHGFPDTAWSFTRLLGDLAKAGFHAVAPFMRGYPPSAVPDDRDYSVMALVRDVIALIEHLGAQEAMVVGHDWGAAAAYGAAALRPDRIRRIVTAAVPHLRRFLLRPTRAQLRASHYMFKLQVRGWAERRLPADDCLWVRNLARSWSPGWEPPDEYFNPVKAALSDPARLKAALGYYRALPRGIVSRETWQSLLKPIQVPARVIYGNNDHCILPEMYQDQQHLFADRYELVCIPGAGHFLHVEAPAAFAEQVVGFLGSG
jgi:pimeloyl-ACP methyl ester carboxylesterase